MLFGTMGAFVSPGGSRGKLLVLNYHRVLPQQDELYPGVDREIFDTQMNVLATCFSPLRLDEALEKMHSGSLPPRAVSITFDDGYADNHDVALPILKKWKIPATFYIATSFLNGGRMWNDTVIESIRRAKSDALDLQEFGIERTDISDVSSRREFVHKVLSQFKHLPWKERADAVQSLQEKVSADLPQDMMMTTDQVKQMHDAGMEIGGHTVTHPILTRIPSEQSRKEIADCKEFLEGVIGEKINGFAYPNGRPDQDYDSSHIGFVKEAGYTYAVTTSRGCTTSEADMYQLPRGGLWDSQQLKLGMRVINEFASAGTGSRVAA